MDALCDFDRTTPQFSDEAPTTDYVLSCNATSTYELAEAVSEWRFEFLQLERGHFEGTVTCLRFDRVLVCCGSMNRSLLQRYTTPAHCVTIARPDRTSSPMLHRGRAISAGECLVAGPSVNGEIVSRGAHSPLAVSVRTDAWESGSSWLAPSALSSVRGVTLLVPGSAWVGLFLSSIAWLTDAVMRYPNAMHCDARRRQLEEWLLARINAFTADDCEPRGQRSVRARRRMAVERAQAYIQENLTDPISLSDLCRHVHMQSRSLEYGFREALGLTPMAYVKMLRLHRVRRLLRSGLSHVRSVSEIALDCGFWHLSQFSVDYKKYFGESPSTTSRRALALTQAAPRRPAAGRLQERSPVLSALGS